MGRDYTIHPKHLQRIHRPQVPNQDYCLSDYDKSDAMDSDASTVTKSKSEASKETGSRYLDMDHRKIKKSWSPINDKFYQDDSSDEDDETDDLGEDADQEDQVPAIRVFPITPPPLN